MKKIAILAATALALTSTMAAAQSAQIQVSRQVLLDGGLAGSSLLRTETAVLNGTTSASAICTLGHNGNAAPVGVATSLAASGGTATASSSNFTLWASRTNPHGQAIGQATYGAQGGGAATWSPTLTVDNTDLSCPSGGTYQEELTPYIPPQLITAAQQGQLITAATTTSAVDQPCRDARKATVDAMGGPGQVAGGYGYGSHCPDIVTVVAAVYGPDIEGVYSAEVPATYATRSYSYTLGQITFGSTLMGSGTVDGVSFSF